MDPVWQAMTGKLAAIHAPHEDNHARALNGQPWMAHDWQIRWPPYVSVTGNYTDNQPSFLFYGCVVTTAAHDLSYDRVIFFILIFSHSHDILILMLYSFS